MTVGELIDVLRTLNRHDTVYVFDRDKEDGEGWVPAEHHGFVTADETSDGGRGYGIT